VEEALSFLQRTLQSGSPCRVAPGFLLEIRVPEGPQEGEPGPLGRAEPGLLQGTLPQHEALAGGAPRVPRRVPPAQSREGCHRQPAAQDPAPSCPGSRCRYTRFDIPGTCCNESA
jgi:hypothetical protein